jgi:predicted nucleic acid-binding protein
VDVRRSVIKLMLDSCVYDVLLLDGSLRNRLYELREAGTVDMLTTQIQREELARTGDEAKRLNLLAIRELLARYVVAAAVVLDETRLNEGRLMGHDGSEEFNRVLRTDYRTGPGHTRDAIIIATAKYEGAVFVTAETKRAAKVARKVGVEVWHVGELSERLAALG